MSRKISILVADDHNIVRYGICSILQSGENIEVVGEASTGVEAFELYKKLRPDISILDITMPDMNGIEACRKIYEYNSSALVIIMTMHLNEEYLNQVLAAGASGYMLKSTKKAELLSNISKVMQGQRVFSDDVSKLMTDSYIRSSKTSGSDEDEKKLHLTRREKEILALIVEGQTNQSIAKKLFISPRTVETHRANLLQKMEVNNTAALVRLAVEQGLV